MDEQTEAGTLRLIARCRQRDEAAFRELIRLYHHPLTYYVRRLVEDVVIAEDVMQEVWMAAWSGIRTLRNPRLFGVWIYRIARNRSARYWKKRVREAALDSMSRTEEPRVLPPVAGRDAARRTHELIEALPLPQREALTLFLIEGMSYEEIAAVTEAPIGTVRSRIHHGRRTLRAWMENENV